MPKTFDNFRTAAVIMSGDFSRHERLDALLEPHDITVLGRITTHQMLQADLGHFRESVEPPKGLIQRAQLLFLDRSMGYGSDCREVDEAYFSQLGQRGFFTVQHLIRAETSGQALDVLPQGVILGCAPDAAFLEHSYFIHEVGSYLGNIDPDTTDKEYVNDALNLASLLLTQAQTQPV